MVRKGAKGASALSTMNECAYLELGLVDVDGVDVLRKVDDVPVDGLADWNMVERRAFLVSVGMGAC